MEGRRGGVPGRRRAGYPNLFILYGPNTNLGHNSIIFMIEAQIRFVLACLDRLREPGVEWIDVRPEAAARYDDDLQQALVGTRVGGRLRQLVQDGRGQGHQQLAQVHLPVLVRAATTVAPTSSWGVR